MVKKLKGKGILAFACTLAVLICMLCISVSADESGNVAKIGETGYATLQEALNAVPNNTETTVVLLQDVTIESGLTVPTGKKIKLTSENASDIKTVTVKGQSKKADSKSWISINNTTLTLENITITRENATGVTPDFAVFNIGTKGTLVMNDDATIKDVAGGNGGAVWAQGDYCSFIMNGGTITGCTALWNGVIGAMSSATFTMTGGTIENNGSNVQTPIVYVKTACKAEITGGTLKGYVVDGTLKARALSAEAGATVTVSDSVIDNAYSGNLAVADKSTVTVVADNSIVTAIKIVSGAGKATIKLTKDETVDLSNERWDISVKKVNIDGTNADGDNFTVTIYGERKADGNDRLLIHDNSDMTLSNVTFTREMKEGTSAAYGLFSIIDANITLGSGAVIKNATGINGGAFYITHEKAKVVMEEGSKIENCESSWGCPAVHLAAAASFTMNGGTITGCKQTGNRCGSAIGGSKGTFVLNGGTIQNNTGVPAVWIDGTAKATVSDELVMSGNTSNIKAAAATGEVTINVEKSLQTAIDLIAENSAAITKIILTKNEVIDAATEPDTDKADTNWKITNKKVLIDGQNYTVTVKTAGKTVPATDTTPRLERGSMGSIRIMGSDVTLKNITFNRSGDGADYGVFVLSNNAVLTLGEGSKITGVTDSNGAAVWSQSNGELIIDGGTIEDCGAGWYRGAVSFMSGSAKLTMKSGSIKNSKNNNATAIWFDKGSTVDIKGGSFDFANTTVPLIVMSDQGGLTDGKLLGTLTIADGVSFGSSTTCVEIDRTRSDNGNATFDGSVSVPAALKDNIAVKVGSGSSLTVTSKTSIVTNEEDGDTFAFVSDGKLYWISPSDFEIKTDFGKYTKSDDAGAAATSTEVHVLRTLTTKSTAGELPVTLFGTVFIKDNGTITTLPTSNAWKNEESATFDEGKGFIVDMVDEKGKTDTSGTVYAVSFFKVNGIDDIVTTTTKEITYDFAGKDVKEISASQVAKNN